MKRKLLPTRLRPRLYKIKLVPDFNNHSFGGCVDIRSAELDAQILFFSSVLTEIIELSCDATHITRSIELHCKYLTIYQITVAYQGSKFTVNPVSIRYNEPEETVQFPVENTIHVDDVVDISLKYSGKFGNDLAGFYQAHYTTEDGEEHHLAVTSMEPTYARQVFPCFDEPSLKARFIISAVVPQEFTCISNMPVACTSIVSASEKQVTFQESIRMSTYLVALVAGPLAQVESQHCTVPLSVFCPIGTEPEAYFALELASRGLQLFEELFDSAYPLPKLDLVAVPDFSAGAMENWGLIMFRTNALLLDPEDSSLDRKQYIAEMLFHEISHMWFGNLVTMKFWDGLWLKEGFATLMAWIASDKLFPSWQVWDRYISSDLQEALELDSLGESHPVELIVQDASEAKQMFDNISYKKGCCVLKMILKELGEDGFLKGIRLYIKRHYLGNTDSEDLWGALEDATGMLVREKMKIWTQCTGFPIVEVTEIPNENGSETVGLRLRQRRFLSTGFRDDDKYCQQVYPLRIGIRSVEGYVRMIDMAEPEITVPVQVNETLKINADHEGFFRTSYSSAHTHKLIKAAIEGHLTLRDCIGLGCDLRALVAAGLNKTSDLLDLTSSFQQMSHYLVWDMIDGNLHTIRSTFKFEERALTDALDHVIVQFLGFKARELGWKIYDDDEDTKITFKAKMFSSAGLAGEQSIITESRALFARRVAGDEKAIHPSLRWEVFGVAAEYGGKKELEGLLHLWMTSSNEDERYLALECLGRASNPELVRWVLKLAFTKRVKDQDLYILLWLISSSRHGAVELWNWAKENWDRIEASGPVDMLCMTLGVVLDGLGTAQQIADVKAYFGARDTRPYERYLNQKIEKMEVREQWARRDKYDVKLWLAKHGYLEVETASSPLRSKIGNESKKGVMHRLTASCPVLMAMMIMTMITLVIII